MKRFIVVFFFFPLVYAVLGFHVVLGAARVNFTDAAYLYQHTTGLYSTAYFLNLVNHVVLKVGAKDTVDMENINTQPLVSVPQFLKGQVSNIYVQEGSGEPGVYKNMVFRGVGSPILSNA